MTTSGRRVFLTGSTGFVGSHALASLRRDRDRAVAILIRPGTDRATLDPEVLDTCELIEGDLESVERFHRALGKFAPDTIINLAWDGVGPDDRDDPRQIRNIAASMALLNVAQDLRVETWVGAGSQAEYGPHLAAIRETDATRPTTLYGACKLSVSHLTRLRASEARLRCAWLRIFSTYGPGDKVRWLIPYVILGLLRGERPQLTEGRQLWDYLHVQDIASAITSVVDASDAEGVFNVGSGRVVSVRGVVKRIRDLIDPDLDLGFGELPYRPDQVMHLEADVGRLHRATGWSPQIDLECGLEQTVSWYKERLHDFVA
jgi:UDP-glucose 4-epimerase